VQDATRPDYSGRIERKLVEAVVGNLKLSFRPTVSKVIPSGRASVLIALLEARFLLQSGKVSRCIVAGVDSLINEDCVAWLYRNGRLRLEANLDGLFPGEGAGAIEITRVNEAAITKGDVLVTGLGQATESATILSGEPNLADGLTSAVKAAVTEGAMSIGEVDFRISDVTGEEYYFRETANSLVRLLRVHKESFPLWHYADSIGDIGAASGAVSLCVAATALRKGYAPGKTVICHSSSDSGQRAAALVCAAN
jgi:3-oxoacyl-[acyl-carrier-protein] synthase-1